MSLRRERLVLAGILLLTVGVYLPTLGHGFTNWDDPAYVATNPDVQEVSWRTLVRVLDPRTRVVSDWTPVVTLSHQLEWMVAGPGPFAPHLGNLGLHLVCALLVWTLLRRAGASLPVAIPGTLLFALHPVQVETVAWVAGRKTLLATLLSIGSLLLFLFGPKGEGARASRAAALLLFVLALGSKGTAVVLPLQVAAGVLLVDRARMRALAPWVGFMLLLALARGLWSVELQSAATRPAADLGLIGRLEITGPVLVTWLGQLAWPADLCGHYAWSPAAGPAIAAWLGIAGLVTILAALGRRDRRVGFFGLWIGIALLPTANLLPAPYFQADRYLYPAMPGLAFVVPTLLVRAIGRPIRASALLTAGVLALVPWTVERIGVWKDGRSLWTDTLQCSPGFAAGWSNLGLIEIEDGNELEAERRFRGALDLDPTHLPAYANLGELLARRGRPSEAEAVFRRGLAVGDHPDLLNNLAWLIVERDPAEAAAFAGRAVRLRPDLAVAWDTLGMARLRAGEPDGARVALERGIALRPDLPDLHLHLAQTFVALGDPAAARTHARRALQLLGDRTADWRDDAAGIAR